MSDGYILPEVVVETVLASGLAQVEAAIANETLDTLLGIILSNESEARRVEFANWLREHDMPVIRRSYPRTAEETPCFSIILDPEQQTEFVGDVLGQDGDQTGDGSYVEDGEVWTSTVGIVVYADNGDLSLWLYHMAKFLLCRKRRDMADEFEHSIAISGRDFGFEPRFLAASSFVYRRALMVTGGYVQRRADEIEWADEILDTVTAAEVVNE